MREAQLYSGDVPWSEILAPFADGTSAIGVYFMPMALGIIDIVAGWLGGGALLQFADQLLNRFAAGVPEREVTLVR